MPDRYRRKQARRHTARAMSLRVVVDMRTGRHHLAGKSSAELRDANRFLQALGLRGLSPHTLRAYAYDICSIYRWMKRAGKRISTLREGDLLAFIAEQRRQALGARTINRRLTVCRLLYRFLTDRQMERGPGLSTPAGYYRGPGRDKDLGLFNLPKAKRLTLQVKVPRTLVEPLTVEQVNSLLRSVRRYRDLCIIHLMLLCGLRSNEVLSLKSMDLCFEDRRVRVHGKGDKERALPLPQVLLDLLADYLRLERPGRCPAEQLFVVLQGPRRGQPMTASGLRSLLRHRRRSQSAVANANPHRFRHTFGADMARAGVRLVVLQKMMGHASSTTTLQYINLSMADIAHEYQRAIEQIERRYRQPEDEQR